MDRPLFYACSLIFFLNSCNIILTSASYLRNSGKDNNYSKKKNQKDMKKFIATLMLAVIFMGAACPQTQAKKKESSNAAIALMEKYDREKGVEYIKISGFLLGIAKMAARGEEDGEILKHLDCMAVFSAENADAGIREQFFGELNGMMAGYEKAVEVNDSGEDMTVWFKYMDKDNISEMIMSTESEGAVIVMCGRLPVSVLEEMAETM